MQGFSEAQRTALVAIADKLPPDAYLAGGVAVALRAGHRVSRDLDVFTVTTDPASLVDAMTEDPAVHVTTNRAGTLYLESHGVPVSVIRHRYPLLAAPDRMEGVAIGVASPADLTAMKLQAIGTRGAARDFWDLAELLRLRGVSLREAVKEFRQRYPSDDPGHIVRSLAYFGDAESEPLPVGLDATRWKEIRHEIESQVKSL
jgi:hypothetical protein